MAPQQGAGSGSQTAGASSSKANADTLVKTAASASNLRTTSFQKLRTPSSATVKTGRSSHIRRKTLSGRRSAQPHPCTSLSAGSHPPFHSQTQYKRSSASLPPRRATKHTPRPQPDSDDEDDDDDDDDEQPAPVRDDPFAEQNSQNGDDGDDEQIEGADDHDELDDEHEEPQPARELPPTKVSDSCM